MLGCIMNKTTIREVKAFPNGYLLDRESMQ